VIQELAFFSSCSGSSHDNYVLKDDIIGKVFIDLWYFNFKNFSFTNTELAISTAPKFFSSLDSYTYK